uniref:BPL/LPL catalytic domain-containing protein n=1 Tax=Mesocestoides corti TaxID=53468 RepID=A0A5K3ESJ2_MESCO
MFGASYHRSTPATFNALRLTKGLVCRYFASTSSLSTSVPNVNRVYWLSSGNIYRNLAFETTLFNNKLRYTIEPSSKTRPADVVMWCSDPCVVIGRNQIAWLETSPHEVEGRGWLLARRMSGGGAVFHDTGNLNVSFLESRSTLKRQECMQFLQHTLMSKWPDLNVFVGPRHDLWLLPSGVSVEEGTKEVPEGGLKFSGAASRFSSVAALHHCTLLFNADLTTMSSVLQPAVPEIETMASRSVPSPVTNLRVPGNELRTTLLQACSKRLGASARDGEAEVVTVNAGEEGNWISRKDFEANLATFQSWDWIYGGSPKFSIPMETEDGTVLRLNCEKGRVVSLVRDGGATSPIPLLQRISSALSRKPSSDAWLEKLNEALAGKPLCFEALHNALLDFEVSVSSATGGDDPEDPFGPKAQIIDRLRAMATCF